MSRSLPAQDKNKNMSLNGIRSQPWQQQSPPPQVDVKKSPLRSDWHTGRSSLNSFKRCPLFFLSKRRKEKQLGQFFSLCTLAFFDLKSTRWREWRWIRGLLLLLLLRRRSCNVVGSLQSGEKTCPHTLLYKWERNQTTSETCQSTGRVSFTSETLCLCTRKARWTASSVLWGMFLLSASLCALTRSIWILILVYLFLLSLNIPPTTPTLLLILNVFTCDSLGKKKIEKKRKEKKRKSVRVWKCATCGQGLSARCLSGNSTQM